MQEAILRMLTALKFHGISISKIEKDLGFSNGLLGKAAKSGYLSVEKLRKLEAYYSDIIYTNVKAIADSMQGVKVASEIKFEKGYKIVPADMASHFPNAPTPKSENELIGEGLVEFCKKNGMTIERAMDALDQFLVAKTMHKIPPKEQPKSNFSIDTVKSQNIPEGLSKSEIMKWMKNNK